MEHSAAGSIYRANRLLVERHEVFVEACRIFRIELEQAATSASNAEHLITFIDRAIDKRLYAGVQPRHISASGQNADCLWHRSTSLIHRDGFAKRVQQKMRSGK